MKHVSIIGFGRFGKTLYHLIKDDFYVVLYDINEINFHDITLTNYTRIVKDLKEVYGSEAIFFAVPISVFESVVTAHKPYFTARHLLIDVLSVKLHPAAIFTKYLEGMRTQALLTHPMFGPDSSKYGFEGLPIIIDRFRAKKTTYNFWKRYFESKKLRVVEMLADEHDKLAADSQGLTHFIGRLLEEYPLKKTPIDSLGAKKLWEIKEQTCNDTWQLFTDLQQYNPYTKQMRVRLGEAYDKVYNKLLPKQVMPGSITFGIQGGRGSFNEEAIFYFLKGEGIKNYRILYLYTSENVLSSLQKGEIDRGLFAVHNSVGGVVEESIKAMAKYKFRIIEEFAVEISHALLIRNDADFNEITTIMSHPQVFAQCKKTLSKKYPHLKQISGEGELIDHAMVADRMSQKKIPKHIATMGSKALAKLYNLTIVEENLQDAQENFTSFLLVGNF